MGHRGRERLVTCEKCGRQVRRDKAVFIDKTVFSNPLERKDIVAGEHYTRIITREVAYCPSCGKHGRIYEKKAKQLERQRERRAFFHHDRPHGFVRRVEPSAMAGGASAEAQKTGGENAGGQQQG